MRLAWVVAFVGIMAPCAEAGPWCGGDTSASPFEGETLPLHPRILYAVTDTRYAGKRRARAALKIKATLDGKPVKLVTKEAKEGDWQLRFVDVKSDKPGVLVVFVGDEQRTTYKLDAAWKRPEKGTLASMRRFSIDTAEERARRYNGIELAVDVPALSFIVRWRRDDKDKWRTYEVPALANDRGRFTPPGETAPPRLPAAYLGETRCGGADIPISLLTAGVELELVARLPDGSKLPIEGIPKPLVIPPAPPAKPGGP